MNKLFVDTNAFESIGFNFDLKNPIIKALMRNAKSGEYIYYNLSVIDNEVTNHIKDRCLKEYSKVKKIKWLKSYLKDNDIKDNCFKDLTDYEKFKNNIAAISCNVSSINPEDILQKYFKIEYPFEKGDKKRKEFPDAFISAYLNKINHNEKEKIYFVSNDIGLKKSLNNNIYTFKDLNSFLASIENISPYKYNEIEEYIYNNNKNIQDNLLKKIYIDTADLEDEEIELEYINIHDIIDVKVIDKDENTYSVHCKCDFLTLEGNFSCLDYNNSYMPNDCDYYVVQEYIKTNKIIINDYEFIIIIKEQKNKKYSISFLDRYVIQIDYDLIIRSNYERIFPYFDYDEEDSFAQDNFTR